MDHRGDLMKTDAEVTFPLKLDLAPFCLFRQGSVEKLLYDLAAVVVHHGNAMGGHFTVFRRVSRTEITNPNLYGAWLSSGGPYKWVHFSDENCQAVTEDTVLRAQPYLLFYERCGPRTAAATEPSKAPSFH
jgi:ubiquitin C-terminal hydrolase